jgi:hypothetical protein
MSFIKRQAGIPNWVQLTFDKIKKENRNVIDRKTFNKLKKGNVVTIDLHFKLEGILEGVASKNSFPNIPLKIDLTPNKSFLRGTFVEDKGNEKFFYPDINVFIEYGVEINETTTIKKVNSTLFDNIAPILKHELLHMYQYLKKVERILDDVPYNNLRRDLINTYNEKNMRRIEKMFSLLDTLKDLRYCLYCSEKDETPAYVLTLLINEDLDSQKRMLEKFHNCLNFNAEKYHEKIVSEFGEERVEEEFQHLKEGVFVKTRWTNVNNMLSFLKLYEKFIKHKMGILLKKYKKYSYMRNTNSQD